MRHKFQGVCLMSMSLANRRVVTQQLRSDLIPRHSFPFAETRSGPLRDPDQLDRDTSRSDASRRACFIRTARPHLWSPINRGIVGAEEPWDGGCPTRGGAGART